MDSTKTIFHSAKRFFSGTAISRVTGLLRDIAMASAFGTNEVVAAFFTAFRFSHLPRRLLGEGALQTAFIPQFETLRKEKDAKAYSFFLTLCGALTLLLTGIIFLTGVVLSAFLLFMDISQGNRDIILLTVLMLPSLLFICLYGLNIGLLQCEKNYFTASVSPVAFNIIWIAAALGLRNYVPEEAMIWLSGAIVIACLFQWLMTVPQIVILLKKHKIQWSEIDLRSPDLRGFAKPLFLGILGIAASQVNNAIDPLFARFADPQGPAYLWYAIRIQQLPIALFGIAISGAILPPLARAIKAKEYENFKMFLEYALRRCIAFLLPITVGMLIMGDACISLLYGRGDFTASSINGTTQCLSAYALGLLPTTFVLILAPAFYAQGDFKIPMRSSIMTMILSLVMNSVFIFGFGFDSVSVALSTSIAAWFNFIYLAYYLKKKTGIALVSKPLVMSTFKIALSCCAGAVAMFALSEFAWSDMEMSRQFTEQFTQLALKGTCFMLALAGMAWIVKAKDLVIWN